MAIKTKYRIKNSNGTYDVIHFQTSADQVITNDEMQFVTAEEKKQIAQIKIYTHHQSTPLDIWNVNHNLGKFPSVTIVDSEGAMVIGDILYIDENNLQISFSSAFSGKAYFN